MLLSETVGLSDVVKSKASSNKNGRRVLAEKGGETLGVPRSHNGGPLCLIIPALYYFYVDDMSLLKLFYHWLPYY